MRGLGKVVTRTAEGCAEYLLPEESTASCDYFEYRPHGSPYTFEVSMPDEIEEVFAFRLSP